MKKKIMIMAYTYFNLGDDLFIKILIERYPRTKFYLFVPKRYRKVFPHSGNLIIIPSESLILRGLNYIFRKFKIQNFCKMLLLKDINATVEIGGSIFIQNQNWKNKIADRKMLLSYNQEGKNFIIGANFGPYSTLDFVDNYTELFSYYEDICFRDELSHNLFKKMSNIRIASDVVFQLKHDTPSKIENNVIISVIEPSNRAELKDYGDLYYQKMKEISLAIIKSGREVVLMSFCKFEGDEVAIKEIMNIIPEEHKKQVNSYFYDNDLDEALEIIRKSSAVVATRFHAMILGWVYGKPVLPVVYSEKMTNVMEDAGYKGQYISFDNLDMMNSDDLIKNLYENIFDVFYAIIAYTYKKWKIG